MAIDLDNVPSGYNTSKINTNFQKIEDYINDKVLARADTGVAGEAMMERDLDMNGYAILNARANPGEDDSLINYKDFKSALRVPIVEEINELPANGFRNSKIVGFDSSGQPAVFPMSTTSADIYADLAQDPGGAAFIGGVSQVFNSVADMKTFGIVSGRAYETKGYYTPGDGGGGKYIAGTTGTTPDGYGDHVASNGVFLRLNSPPTDLNHGVKINATYIPTEARSNRNALQSMMRNTRWSETTCVAEGTYYILGSVNIGRDNIRWTVNKGCYIRGRYSDPSIPTPDQAGGMFNFLHYFDPDNGDFIPFASGDTRVNPYIKNVHVVIHGDISSEYNAIHTNQYNNNCVSIGKAIDCTITGSGGVGESDHRGVIFEGIDTNAPGGSENRGGCINCHIDINYLNNCVDNPVMIRGDRFTPAFNTIKVHSVGTMKTGGFNNPIVVNIDGPLTDFGINVNKFLGDNVVKPAVIVSNNCRSVKARVGYCNGASSVWLNNSALDSVLEVEEVYNTPTLLIRGGSTSGVHRTLAVRGLKSTDSNLQSAISSQNNTGPFQRMEISGNSFSGVGSGFYLHAGRLAGALPVIEDVRDNFIPTTGEKSGVLNKLTNGFSSNLVPSEVLSTSFDYKAPTGVTSGNFKWEYTKASICIRNGGARGLVEMDLRARSFTSNDIVLVAGAQQINTSISGTNITVTATSPAVISYIVLYN